jgi:hypothetical protein
MLLDIGIYPDGGYAVLASGCVSCGAMENSSRGEASTDGGGHRWRVSGYDDCLIPGRSGLVGDDSIG